MSTKRGFTLIELLIVISILAIITSFLSSLIGIARRQAMMTNTRAILMKVDQAVRLFRNETKIYPHQTDLSQADTDPSQWTNNLAFRLAWKPADAAERSSYMAKFQADLSEINRRFVYLDGNRANPMNGSHAFHVENPGTTGRTNIMISPGTFGIVPDANFTIQNGGAQGAIVRGDMALTQGLVLSRLAAEITCMRYMSGCLDRSATVPSPLATLEAPQGILPTDLDSRGARKYPFEDTRYAILNYGPIGYRYVPYNRESDVGFGNDKRGPVLTAATAQASGFRADYLADALRRRVPGGRIGEIDESGSAILDAYGQPLIYVCSVAPGARAYTHASDEGGSTADEHRYGMGPSGREATTSMDSDVRTTADAPFTLEFELWSAGPDGKFSHRRDDPVNRDNIALLRYTKGLR